MTSPPKTPSYTVVETFTVSTMTKKKEHLYLHSKEKNPKISKLNRIKKEKKFKKEKLEQMKLSLMSFSLFQLLGRR